MEIITNESFSDEDKLFEKIEKREFENQDFFNLKVKSDEINEEFEINNLISYDSIKKNLQFDLPHQKNGALKILRDMNASALLADEVGLGKTITAGIVLKEGIERKFIKSALILTPPSLVDQWSAELKEKFELDFKIIENENDWNSKFVICSIDRIKSYNKNLRRFNHEKAQKICWDILLVDEAHKLKDKDTARWKFIDKIQKKRFLILTATPFQNDLIELYNLLQLLKRGHLGTLKEFKKQFLNKGNKRHPLNPHELKRKLDEVMIRRRRDETKIQYTKRIPKIIPVKLSDEEFEIYNDIIALLKNKYFACSGKAINASLSIYSILPKITSSSKSAIETLEKISENETYHPETREFARKISKKYEEIKKDSKIEAIIKIVKEIFSEDKNSKALIYTKHPATLKYIVEKLKPFDFSIVQFLGGLCREEKTQIIKEFKENAQIMISTETGSEGLNLQFCNNLINYDLPWNPMAVEQRIGRLDRIGQKKDINIYSLATQDTMEEHVVDLIINKMCCIGLVIGELPIILFNLGLDQKDSSGINKIEEMLMNSFINSKNNLKVFAEDVSRINELVQKGIDDYNAAKKINSEVLDG